MQTRGIEANIVGLRIMGEEEIIKAAGQAFDTHDKVREQLGQTIRHVKETVLGLSTQFPGLPE